MVHECFVYVYICILHACLWRPEKGIKYKYLLSIQITGVRYRAGVCMCVVVLFCFETKFHYVSLVDLQLTI